MLNQVEEGRRGYFRIISDILLTANSCALMTEIMQKVGLSYAQLERYGPMLIRAKVLKMSNRKKSVVYKTTKKGRDLLKRIQELDKLLKV